MIQDNESSKLSLLGEIAETYEKDGHRIAVIALRSCRIDISRDAFPEAHLGDTVVIKGELSISSIQFVASPEAHP